MCPKPNNAEAHAPLPRYNKAIFWGIGGLFFPFVAPVAVILGIKGLKKHVPKEVHTFRTTTIISLILGSIGSSALLFVLFVLVPSSDSTIKKPSESQSAHVFASDLYVTEGGDFAALKKENFDLMVKRLGDTEALRKMKAAGMIFILKEGVEVYRENITWGGAVQLRPKGETFTFWTFKEAIKKK